MDNLSGQTIKGYELQERIGQGGFGAVYRAYQTLVKREVAIKIILPQYANHPDFIRRFEAEAQLVARLEHLHIVPLYDYWRDPSGAFLVMRWLRGGSMQDSLKRGVWNPEDAARLLDQIAAALTVAHRNGVIHRDLKPANILLDEERNAYLSDFGIAKDLGHDGKLSALSDELDAPGTVIGSPAYMSPEQIRSKSITPQTDVYGLGIVMFEVLTGQQPFPDAQSSELILRHLNDPLPPLRQLRDELPTSLNRVVQKATAKDPEDRYIDTLTFAADFRRALSSAAPAARPTSLGDGDDDLIIITRDTATTGPITIDTNLLMLAEPVNPYKGLRAFQVADASDFFGRDNLVDQLLKRLREPHPYSRFLAVIGPSGSGKSSVVKAGLIPRLRGGAITGYGSSFYAEMVPGPHPVTQLETELLSFAVDADEAMLKRLREDENGLTEMVKAVLPGADSELVLVIDQFEEVFTLVENEAERAHFLNSLLAAVRDPSSRIQLIITLRADFYDRPLLYPEFGALIRERTEVVLPLSADELERAIVGPAKRVGLLVEPQLVAAIVGDISNEPGALPLLQYALTEVFERRDGMTLNIKAYQDIGGALGALARRAEEIFVELDNEKQSATRQMFLRLVAVGEGNEDTRRRAHWAELISVAGQQQEVMEAVIEIFGKSRLLTFDNDPQTREPTVEVAHEALIRQWVRLREWLNDSREDLRLQRRLTSETTEWFDHQQDTNYLVGGVRLQQYEALLAGGDIALNQREVDFIHASVQKRELDMAAEQERKAREAELRRRNRNRGLALIAAVLVAVMGIGLTIFAFSESRRAESARADAVDSAQTAQYLQGIAAQQAATSNQAATIAVDSASTAEIAAVTATVAQGNAEQQAQAAETARGDAINQAFIAATSAQEAKNNAATATYAQGDAQEKADVASTAQADALVQANIASTQAAIAQENAIKATVAQGQAQDQANRASTQAAIAEENAIAATVAQGQAEINANDASTQAAIAQNNAATAIEAQSQAEANANDASTQAAIVQTESAGRLAAEDVAKIQQQLAQSVLQAANAQQVALQNGDNQLSIALALQANQSDQPSALAQSVLAQVGYAPGVRQKFAGHAGRVLATAISPDGRYLATGGDDKTIILWDIESGNIVRRFQGHTNWVRSVAFSPDGRTILSGSEDNTLILWDVETGEQIRQFKGHTNTVFSVAFSPDGQRALSGSGDTTLILWNVATGAQIQKLSGNLGPVASVAFSPDGLTALSGSVENGTDSRRGVVVLWDIVGGREIRRFEGHTDWVRTVAFSPDGRTILTGADDTQLILWDIASGQEIRRFDGHTDWVRSVAFTPDGLRFVSASADDTLKIWEVESGALLYTLRGHSANVNTVVVHPDGLTVFSGADDMTLLRWDLNPGAVTEQFSGRGAPNGDLAISPDGHTVLTGSLDGTVILWAIETGQVVNRLVGHTAPVNSVVFNFNGQYALSGSDDTTAIWWNVLTGQVVLRLQGHTSPVTSVAISPDGETALTGSQDGLLILWNLLTGEEIKRFEGYEGQVYAVAFSLDGQQALGGFEDSSLILWDVSTGEEVHRFEGHGGPVTSVEFSPRGGSILSGSKDATLVLWDIQTATRIREFVGQDAPITRAQFTPDGTQILSAGENGVLILWDRETGAIIHRYENTIAGKIFGMDIAPTSNSFRIMAGGLNRVLTLWDAENETPLHQFANLGHGGPVKDIVVSTDNQLMLSGSNDHTLILWDVSTGQEIRRFEGHTGRILTAAFNADNSLIVSGSDDGEIILWDMATGQQVRQFTGHVGPVYSIVWQNSASRLISSGEDGQIILWDATSGAQIQQLTHQDTAILSLALSADEQFLLSGGSDGTIILWTLAVEEVRRFTGHLGPVNSVAFSPDGQQVLSGSADESLILWDTNTGSEIRRYRRHIAAVNSVAFSPDGLTALSGSSDSTVILWDLESGEEIRRFEGHRGGVNHVTFSYDGHSAFSASDDSSIIEWRIDTLKELKTWVSENRLVRNLTCNEREIYIVEPFCTALEVAQTGTPTPSPTLPVQPQIRLVYTEDSILLFNISPFQQNVSDLTFVGDSFGSFSTAQWLPANINLDDLRRMLPDACLQLVTRDEAVLPSPCRNSLGWIRQGAASTHFWTVANGNSVFYVRRGEETLATCSISAATCEFAVTEE
ncbi:MAG: protein kinase [Chloroflexi bacterium]|nr:protein kinase [Chloroflexota bacterium]